MYGKCTYANVCESVYAYFNIEEEKKLYLRSIFVLLFQLEKEKK